MADQVSVFAAVSVALYAAHHVGDYWVQTDHQARHKGAAGAEGVKACAAHVGTYLATQVFFMAGAAVALGFRVSLLGLVLGLLVSGVTHYLADRREHGLMFKLARLLPGKARFLALGVPRPSLEIELWEPCPSCEGRGTSYDESTSGKCWDCRGGGMLPGHVLVTDNPSLGTGGWALDQSWHIFFGVFVAALLVVSL